MKGQVSGFRCQVSGEGTRFSRYCPGVARRAFTLIELMVVCAIMLVIVGSIAVPLYRHWKEQDLRKSVRDILEICGHARAQAILKGSTVTVVFHPNDGKVEIQGGSGGTGDAAPNVDIVGVAPGASKLATAQLSEHVAFEMLDINQWEYNKSDSASVAFFPNGRSYEMTLILLSTKNERRVITLEPLTGLASVDDWDSWIRRQRR